MNGYEKNLLFHISSDSSNENAHTSWKQNRPVVSQKLQLPPPQIVNPYLALSTRHGNTNDHIIR
jgi:hypothetical protein